MAFDRVRQRVQQPGQPQNQPAQKGGFNRVQQRVQPQPQQQPVQRPDLKTRLREERPDFGRTRPIRPMPGSTMRPDQIPGGIVTRSPRQSLVEALENARNNPALNTPIQYNFGGSPMGRLGLSNRRVALLEALRRRGQL